MQNPITIIGTGLAGYQLAKEFRKRDSKTPLLIVTHDDGKYYSKPQLSTALTHGKTADMLPTATADTMAKQLNATLLTHHTVTAIDPKEKMIITPDKKLAYAKCVLAVGADVIKADIKGPAVKEILSINHIYHYAEFRDLLQNKKHITILGAGLIGSEFANDLSNAGFEVHVVAPAKAPLDLLIPEAIGKMLQTALEKNSVRFHLECVVTHMDKINNHYHLTLSNGSLLETELVLSAIGLKPHIALAKTAGLAINRGILVNRYLETSISDIYALGDCAEVEGHVLPFITPLLNCSRALANTLSGVKTATEYPGMPVVVKTPAHPIVVCPPPKNIQGEWKIEILGHSVRALFFDSKNKLYGFVLTNEAVKERAVLAKEIPELF